MATDYVDVPDPNLDHPYVARSTDIKRLRENIRYLKEHMDILEDATSLRAFSHFNRSHGYASDNIVSASTITHYDGAFFLSANGAGQIKNKVAAGGATTLDHYISLSSSPGVVIAENAFLFDFMTKPLIFETRLRFTSAGGDSFVAGFANWPAALNVLEANPNDGIVLQQGAAGGNYRFRSSNNGSATNGADFTRPLSDAWFTVQIIFTDDPVDKALCYVDFEDTNGFVEEADLQTNIPTDRRIYGKVAHSAGSNLDVDYILVAGSASLADTA